MKNAIKVMCFVLAVVIVSTTVLFVYFKWDKGEFKFIDGTEKNTAIITQYTGESVNIVIPNEIRGKKVISVDDSAFSGSNIESLKTNKYMTSIGKNAFSECKKLKTVEIGESVKSIGNNCFINCESLESATLSKSLEKMGVLIFGKDTSLKSVTFEDNSFFKIVDGVIYSADMTSVYEALPYANLSNYTLPESVTEIKGYAFCCHPELKSFKINEGIKVIPEGTFYSCSELTDITVPSSVTKIDNIAFTDTGLETIKLPETVANINSSAFYNMENQLTIITTANSKAEEFAKQNNLKYKIVDSLK